MATDQPAYEPPDRKQRAICWDSRDKFFSCLDKNNIVSGESRDAGQKCGQEQAEFKEKCFQSWYKYFQDKRLYDLRKEDKIKELKQQGAKKL